MTWAITGLAIISQQTCTGFRYTDTARHCAEAATEQDAARIMKLSCNCWFCSCSRSFDYLC